LCVDAYYVKNLIARISTFICTTESKYQCTIIDLLWRLSDYFSTLIKPDW